jgi:hypothetical protein
VFGGTILGELGFSEDSRENAPVCRWVQQGTVLDVMPFDEKIFGFSNRWYGAAMEESETISVERGLEIHTITAPYFIATKLEAFKGRGEGDFFGSHDLEDLISVVDGRATLLQEVQSRKFELRASIGAEIKALMDMPGFLDALPAYLLPDALSQSRITTILQRLEQLATMSVELSCSVNTSPDLAIFAVRKAHDFRTPD